MAVRSAGLALLADADWVNAPIVYECPSGRTAILKDLQVTNAGSGARFVAPYVRRNGQNAWLAYTTLAAGASLSLAGRFTVLEPGDQLRMYADGGGLTLIASGAVLVGVES